MPAPIGSSLRNMQDAKIESMAIGTVSVAIHHRMDAR
jgi:hypothetical protein